MIASVFLRRGSGERGKQYNPLSSSCLFVVSILMLAVMLAGCAASPSETQRLFLSANAKYESGDYSGALAAYQALVAAGTERGNLYFNLANCYYKLGRLAEAVLYYERALALQPRDEDAKYNLAFTRSQTIDELQPPDGWQAVEEALGSGTLSQREVWTASIVCYWLLFLLTACLLLLPDRRLLVYIRYGVLACLGFSLMLTAYLYWRSASLERGVIMAEQVLVRNEPAETGGVEFKLHAGTVVRLLNHHEGWQAVSVGEELKGWVLAGEVEEI